MLTRCILPSWVDDGQVRVLEGDFSEERLHELNSQAYNIYYLPNHPSVYESDQTVSGHHIDTFEWVYADMDTKEGVWTKEEFINYVLAEEPVPTKVVDSGNGIHVYWHITDLDANSFLRLQRRICRKYKTDEAVAKIFQLMRLPGYLNTKLKENLAVCQEIFYDADAVYTCEQMDSYLPIIMAADEEYCKTHYNKTYQIDQKTVIKEEIPQKFYRLIRENKEVKSIWGGNVNDRSTSDYRLGHIMFANDFTKAEAMSVLANSAKALARAPIHRVSYAENIVNKIWTYEELKEDPNLTLSSSVSSILKASGTDLKGVRFPCYRYFDDTAHGFRLGQVVGLIAGVGVGKTAVALNMFMGFVKANPNYVHFFVPLEQPKEEIAERWRTMCGENTRLHDRVHILSNYADDGSYRHLSLQEIQEYLLRFQESTGNKVGAVVIDHIGVLKKKTKDGENQGLMDICHEMKAFAIKTQTMMIMQSQAPREKAGIGDLELNKDAAYGTVFFESYCDYLITVWQPLKRVYKDGAPTVTAYKFCKIRHKKQGVDTIQEDTRYLVYYDPETQLMRELTPDQEKGLEFFNNKATNERKKDRKTDLVQYTKITFEKEADTDGTLNNDQNSEGT